MRKRSKGVRVPGLGRRGMSVLAVGATVTLVLLAILARRGDDAARLEPPLEALSAGAPASAQDPTGASERVVRALEAELELAGTRSYYLVLDPEPGTLRLMHHGVILDEMEVRTIEVGLPRFAFFRASAPEDLFDRPWSGGRLDPRRVRVRTEITAPSDSAVTNDPPIPPLPEELYPTPDRFFVRYPDRFVLEVVPDDSTGSSGSHGIGDFVSALLRRDRFRLRLGLSMEDVGMLYRSLPDSSAFLAASVAPLEGSELATSPPTRSAAAVSIPHPTGDRHQSNTQAARVR